jgi:hypothetical protein
MNSSNFEDFVIVFSEQKPNDSTSKQLLKPLVLVEPTKSGQNQTSIYDDKIKQLQNDLLVSKSEIQLLKDNLRNYKNELKLVLLSNSKKNNNIDEKSESSWHAFITANFSDKPIKAKVNVKCPSCLINFSKILHMKKDSFMKKSFAEQDQLSENGLKQKKSDSDSDSDDDCSVM